MRITIYIYIYIYIYMSFHIFRQAAVWCKITRNIMNMHTNNKLFNHFRQLSNVGQLF